MILIAKVRCRTWTAPSGSIASISPSIRSIPFLSSLHGGKRSHYGLFVVAAPGSQGFDQHERGDRRGGTELPADNGFSCYQCSETAGSFPCGCACQQFSRGRACLRRYRGGEL